MKVGRQIFEVVMIDILENLPVRSLIRFRSVSKFWCSVINSSYFITRHLVKRRLNGNVLLVRRFTDTPQRDDVLSFHDMHSDELNEVWPNMSIPFPKNIEHGYRLHNFSNVHLLGPIDGIICIVCDGCVILSNPALREFKQIPPCLYTSQNGFYDYFISQGFGNASSNDFKVLLIRNVDPSGDPDYPDSILEWRVLVHLYNLGTNSWKTISDSINFPKVHRRQCSDVFFNGAFHWNAASLKTGIRLDIVLSLDLNTEVFTQFEYPDCFKNLLESYPCLRVLDECLSILLFKQGMREPVEIWIMKEYGVRESWTKQFVIGPYLVISPFCYWKNDEWLLMENNHGQLASCAIQTNAVKTFQIFGVKRTLCALIYKGSLVSVK